MSQPDDRSVVPLGLAKLRLSAFVRSDGGGPHKASTLAYVIWPHRHFKTGQGAGAAATRVLKRVGWYWTSVSRDWGWRPK